MPSNWGQSGYKHDDHRIQREIERVGKSFGNLDKDVAEITNQIEGLSKPDKKKLLEVLHNMNLVTKPTYQINFSDKGNVQFDVRQTDTNQATIEANLDTENTSILDKYKTSWELREHADYTILDGVVGITPLTTEIINREIQGSFTPYPKSNTGEGWIPFSCDKEVIEDVNNYCYNKALTYAPSYTKNAFVFKPDTPGIYRINALLYLKVVLKAIQEPAARFYDSIDQGMLIIEKFDYDDVWGEPPTYLSWNPVQNTLGNHDHTYAILDMKARFGDLDTSRNYSIAPIPNYYPALKDPGPPPIYVNEFGTPDGLGYHRDIQLGNNVNMALKEGECFVIWYKVYGRRLRIDGGTGYVNEFPATMYIEDRSERIDIEYVAPLGTDDEIDKQSVIEIVRRF